MKMLEILLAQSTVTALGLALIHFIWQGALVALLLAGVQAMLRRRSANARYAVACAAMLLMLVLPLASMVIINLSSSGEVASGLPRGFATRPEPQLLPDSMESASTSTSIAAASPQTWTSSWSDSLALWLPWIILGWLFGVSFFSLRLTCGWLYIQRLKSHGVRPLDENWRQILQRLCRQLRVMQPVRLFESTLVKVPTAIGWLRPVILLPAGALTGLTPQQLEAIIAHELAHLRRHDYLINLLQAAVETLLFYHPAVWWVSRQIRNEREHCCDDLAVAVCGDVLTYARALIELEQLRAGEPQLAVAANGGLLMNRIHRLVGVQTQHPNSFTVVFAGIILVTAVVGVVMGAQISLNNGSQQTSAMLRMALIREPQEDVSADVVERIKELGSPNPEERAAAACALGTMTTRAVPAIPYLIALLSDGTPIDPRQSCKNEPPFEDEQWQPRYDQVREPSPGEAATHALMAIGKPALEPLITALLDGEHWRTRKNAAWALAHRGKAVEQLIVALKDEAWQVRTQAAYALFQRGGSGPRVVSALIETASEDPAWQARAQAVMALGQKGDSRIDVIAPLIAALKDGHAQVRLEAVNGLWHCADSRAFDPLMAALKDEHPEVRARAAQTLGNRADDREVQLLIAALDDHDENVRNGARQALNVIKKRLKGQVTNLRPVTIPD